MLFLGSEFNIFRNSPKAVIVAICRYLASWLLAIHNVNVLMNATNKGENSCQKAMMFFMPVMDMEICQSLLRKDSITIKTIQASRHSDKNPMQRLINLIFWSRPHLLIFIFLVTPARAPRTAVNKRKCEALSVICTEVLDYLEANKQYPTPVWLSEQSARIAIQVMNEVHTLASLKFSRFPYKDKSENTFINM